MGTVSMIDIEAFTPGLHLSADGIWYSLDGRLLSYPSDGNESCFAVEDASFWFRHRNNCIISVVQSFPPPGNSAIFDIGGGNGFVSMGLCSAGFDTVLVEPGRLGVANAKRRGIKNIICATAETASFKRQSLNAVALFDVIEHIQDDVAFLRLIKTFMRPNGCLYVTVPAIPALWSGEDVCAGHFRRYTLNSLSTVLNSADFKIAFSSYFFSLLPVPIFLLRVLPYRLGLSKRNGKYTANLREHAVGASHIVEKIMKFEIDILNKKRSMHVGSSCLIVARAS